MSGPQRKRGVTLLVIGILLAIPSLMGLVLGAIY